MAQPVEVRTEADLRSAADTLIAAFAKEGYPIRAPVEVVVRRDLPPMATSYRSGRGFVILVSDRAFEAGHVGLLLAHELGHVQRMDAEHPSHDDDAITAAYAGLPASALQHEYQRAILHHAINFTQDLSADPLSFRVARALGLVEQAELDGLIDGFVNDEPYEIADPRERRWDQVEDMVGNARAIALARLAGAPAALARAEEVQRRYLARLPEDIAREAPWFQAALDDLPEDTTRERFSRMLAEYVRRFAATAEGGGVDGGPSVEGED